MATYNTLKDALKAFETDVVAQIHPTKADLAVVNEEVANKVNATDVYTKTEVDTKIADVATGGSVDLSNYYTKSESNDLLAEKAALNHTHEQYITEHQDISGKADKSELFSKDYNDLTNKPTIPSIEGLATEDFVTNKIAEAQLSGGETEIDLSGYATKDDIKSFISEIPAEYVTDEELNAKGYLTAHQDISGKADITYVNTELAKKASAEHTHNYLTTVPAEYVTETELEEKNYANTDYVDTKIAELVNGAPESINALKELGEALSAHETEYDALLAVVGGKANAADVYTKTEVNVELAKKAAVDHVHDDVYASKTDLSNIQIELQTKLTSDDLSGYATKTYVDTKDADLDAKIAALSGILTPDSGADNPSYELDLSAYATKTELASKVDISAFQLSDAQIAEILTNTK